MNCLNLLLRRYDKYQGQNADKTAQLNFDELNAFMLDNGHIRDLKMKNMHYLDTDALSNQIENIYERFDALDEE